MAALVSGIALGRGVQTRSPLFDRRVIALAATRPATDRRTPTETKRLLRAAVRGLVPDEVLAPRRSRTGLPGRYLERSFAEMWPALGVALRDGCALADLGIVDGDALRRQVDEVARDPSTRSPDTGMLFDTLEAECWIRGHGVGEHDARQVA